jgi:hypothetical protein
MGISQRQPGNKKTSFECHLALPTANSDCITVATNLSIHVQIQTTEA